MGDIADYYIDQMTSGRMPVGKIGKPVTEKDIRVICPYCGAQAKIMNSSIIYGKSFGPAWVCTNYPACDAYVGCHPGTHTPLGTLANSELRRWRNQAHALFDPLWKTRKMTRSSAYTWLSEALNIPSEQCHIGMFNIEQCKALTNLFMKEKTKMANNNPTSVTTNEVRISYEHLVKPYANQPGAEEKFSATLLIPKSDIATRQRIDAAIAAAINNGITSQWNGARPPVIPLPLHDGDGVRPNGESFGDECKGHWVMTASSKQRPEVVDAGLNSIIDPTQIYSGMFARVNVNFFAYNKAGKRGIGCGLGPVQKTRDGDPLGSRVSAADAFGDTSPQPTYQPPAPPAYQQPAAPYYGQQVHPITGQPI